MGPDLEQYCLAFLQRLWTTLAMCKITAAWWGAPPQLHGGVLLMAAWSE